MAKYFLLGFAFACLPLSAAADASLSDQLEAELAKALPRMACNLSPRQEKVFREMRDGKEIERRIRPAPGSVAASPNTDNPDYYFHWNRDSAITVRALIALLPKVEGRPAADSIRLFLADFVRFSEGLQASESPYGLGEVRFHLDGSVEDAPWSRPQHDGPGLRALAMLDLLALGEAAADHETLARARAVLKADLDHLSYAFEAKSYDLWEMTFGHHFFTRLVQLAALERGAKEWPSLARREWKKAALSLRQDMPRHWSEKDGYYHFSAGKVTNWEGDEVPELGGGKDASTIAAANLARFSRGDFSLEDGRLLSSAWSVEEYFRGAYAINKAHAEAPAIGRFPGDEYYDGHPWFVLTSAYAELYYRLAAKLAGEEAYLVNKENRPLLSAVAGQDLALGTNVAKDGGLRDALVNGMRAKGDGFLRTMLDFIPKDGSMAEQFSKEDGSPVSASDLTWSYSAFLSAALARGDLRWDAISLNCAD